MAIDIRIVANRSMELLSPEDVMRIASAAADSAGGGEELHGFFRCGRMVLPLRSWKKDGQEREAEETKFAWSGVTRRRWHP